jgi:bacteriocin biosynthesis cyclodehydratase domain-containing protein
MGLRGEAGGQTVGGPWHPDGVRPALKQGLLPLWRDRDTLQFGIDSRRAVALTGMASAACLLALLDGSRDRAQVIAAAVDRGLPADQADHVLTMLAGGGALDDFPAGAYRALGPELCARLSPELADVSLAHGDTDGGARILARRQAARIEVLGPGPIAEAVMSILARTGIGQTVGTGSQGHPWPPPPQVPGPGRRARTKSAPSTPPAGPGHPTEEARADGARPGPGRAAAPTARRVRGLMAGREPRPDLVVLVGRPDPEAGARLVAEGLAHLSAFGSEAIGVVGPLVVPGQTACLRCLDLTRTERDPAWPLLLAQLTGRQAGSPSCGAVLAAMVAAQATAQALDFIDRPGRPGPARDGTLELVLPGWQWRRRSWRRHPGCGCGEGTLRPAR